MGRGLLWLAVISMAAVALAGCTDGPPAEPKGPDDGLQPTEETGIIRGVIVDEAVRPAAGVLVTVRVPDGDDRTATTGADGLFGFDGLAPGSHFVTASKLGFFDAQQSVDVVAGVADPPIVRMLLQVDKENIPYATQHVFDGIIECAVAGLSAGFNACGFANDVSDFGGLGNVTNDDAQVRYPFDRTPTWIQSEMTWDSTQALGGELQIMYSYGDCGGGFYCDHAARGPSPLVLTANETIAKAMVDEEGEIYIRVFSDDMDETAPGCYADPSGGPDVCVEGAGLTIEQQFKVITHVFYGYQPPEGWTFGAHGDPPAPV